MTTSHLITLWGIEEVSNCPYKFDDVLERSLRLFVTNKRWMFPKNLRWCGRRQSSFPWAPPSCTRWPGGRRRWREAGTAICNVLNIQSLSSKGGEISWNTIIFKKRRLVHKSLHWRASSFDAKQHWWPTFQKYVLPPLFARLQDTLMITYNTFTINENWENNVNNLTCKRISENSTVRERIWCLAQITNMSTAQLPLILPKKFQMISTWN